MKRSGAPPGRGNGLKRDQSDRLINRLAASPAETEIQQSFGLFEQKIDIHKWLMPDILPKNSTARIDEKRAVQGLTLEIVVRSETLKSILFRVGQKWEYDRFVKAGNAISQLCKIFCADCYYLKSKFLELIHLGETTPNCSTQCKHPEPKYSMTM